VTSRISVSKGRLDEYVAEKSGPDRPLLGELVSFLHAKAFSLVEFGERFYDDKHRLYSVNAFFFAGKYLKEYSLDREPS